MTTFNNEENRNASSNLHELLPEELVALFNREVGNPHWVSARGRFLVALAEAFTHHNIDYSCVANSSGGFKLTKGNHVFLEEKRLVHVSCRAYSGRLVDLLQRDFEHYPPTVRHYQVSSGSVAASDLSDADVVLLFLGSRSHGVYIHLDKVKDTFLLGFEENGGKYEFNSAQYVNSNHKGGFTHLTHANLVYLVKARHFGEAHRKHLQLRTRI